MYAGRDKPNSERNATCTVVESGTSGGVKIQKVLIGGPGSLAILLHGRDIMDVQSGGFHNRFPLACGHRADSLWEVSDNLSTGALGTLDELG